METIILAGGFGTRLHPIVKDIPKPMADINGKPFLSYLMKFLSKQYINKILLSVGYKYEIIRDYFGLKYENIDIKYVIENKPLGTGGAIRETLKYAKGDEVIVLNGDTFFNVNLKELIDFHHMHNLLLTIAVKPMYNFNRYGTIVLKDNRVINFEEKSFKDFGYINGGIYVMKKALSDFLEQGNDVFSFEVDFLQKNIENIRPYAFISHGYFIDIGIPEDYQRAQQELKTFFEENYINDHFKNTA
jgi:D-glycero-alpha-D-manno-heptose 1-phosphate guanylyltransferase